MASSQPKSQATVPLGSINGALTIAAIDVIPIVVPLDREYRGSFYGMQTRSTVLTRVSTNEGIVGEAYAGDEANHLADIVRVIESEISPVLVGENALAFERCWQKCQHVTFDQLRDRRIGLVALACVDFAIWDAIGKALGQPLWRLWGGFRDEIAVNIIGGYYGADDIETEASRWLEMGFRGCKFKIGRSPSVDVERVHALREVTGPEFVITVDANQGYTLAEALEFCAGVQDTNIRWFEEPCIWRNDHRDMREIRVRGGMPVCAGQSEYSPERCRDMMEVGAIDVCNFDASWTGGYTSWKRMAAAAGLYSVELAHHEEPHVASHLLTSQPHGTYLEVFHPERDPIWWQMITNRPEMTNGTVSMSDAPGLGWELDSDFIEHYRVDI